MCLFKIAYFTHWVLICIGSFWFLVFFVLWIERGKKKLRNKNVIFEQSKTKLIQTPKLCIFSVSHNLKNGLIVWLWYLPLCIVWTCILSGKVLSFPQIAQEFGDRIGVYRKFFSLLAIELLVWHHYCVWEKDLTSCYVQEFFWSFYIRWESLVAQETWWMLCRRWWR